MTNRDVPINVSVTFRHTESTPALKTYAIEKISACLSKYLTHAAEVHIILLVEKRDHVAEVVVHSKGHDVSGKAATGDLYSSIDKVVDTIQAQLRKQKDKLMSQKHIAAEP